MTQELFETAKPVTITALEVERFKKVLAFSCQIEGDHLIIGGKSGAGKSSNIHAIAWAIGGDRFKPSDPNNDASLDPAHIKVTLSNGLIAERKGKVGALHITDPTGKKAGQALLNEFITSFALDLPKFINSTSPEKAKILLQIIGVGDRLVELDTEETRVYNLREAHGRIADARKKYAQELQSYTDVEFEVISSQDIIREQQVAINHNSEIDQAERELARLQAEALKINARIEQATLSGVAAEQDLDSIQIPNEPAPDESIDDLQDQIQALQGVMHARIELNRLKARERSDRERAISARAEKARELERIVMESKRLEAEKEKLGETLRNGIQLPERIDLSAIEQRLESMEAVNAKVRANQEKLSALAESAKLSAQYDRYTSEIEATRKAKIDLLNSANLPLPELSVKDGELLYKGKQWDCMSGSDQLKVSTAIVRKLNPKMGFILVDRLEQLDVDTLREFTEWATAEGFQVIGTRVSTGSENTIIIEDGRVKS